jgi:hypothetical protein
VEDVSEPLAGPLAEALARGRGAYNARFAIARRSTPGLEEHAFLELLRGLDGIVRAAHAHDAAVVDRVTEALFDAALQLAGQGLAGPLARTPEVDACWRTLLEAAPRLLCADPRRVVAATANALTSLSACRGARLADWTRGMAALATRAPDVDAWLEAGKVAAWRAGMAHARAGAIALCARLPPDLAALALDLDASTGAEAMARVVERLEGDPWAWPAYVASGQDVPVGIKYITLVGGFRGFGTGPFLAPPRVGLRDGVFVLSDGERAWELHIDFFGATLVPCAPEPGAAHAQGALVLGDDGEVRLGEQRRTFPGMASPTSWASTDTTLVATRGISHRAAVVARSGYGL